MRTLQCISVLIKKIMGTWYVSPVKTDFSEVYFDPVGMEPIIPKVGATPRQLCKKGYILKSFIGSVYLTLSTYVWNLRDKQ